jgi:hypothetical protein
VQLALWGGDYSIIGYNSKQHCYKAAELRIAVTASSEKDVEVMRSLLWRPRNLLDVLQLEKAH